jgi:predicted secreted protein
LQHTVTPSGAEAWYATDLAFSENTLLNGTSVVTGDRTLATVAWTDGEALQVRATTINVTSGATVSDWVRQ